MEQSLCSEMRSLWNENNIQEITAQHKHDEGRALQES